MDNTKRYSRIHGEIDRNIRHKEHTTTFCRFLDLPPELRALVCEFIAYDTTISLNDVSYWRNWPAICLTSHQMNAEAVPVVYRCAAFHAEVYHFDFSQVMNFVEYSPPKCQRALHSNGRLSIFFDGHDGETYPQKDPRKDPFFGLDSKKRRELCLRRLRPWLTNCQSRTKTGSYIQWNYQPKRIKPYPYPLREPVFAWILSELGYYDVRNVHESTSNEGDKRELNRILTAFCDYADSFFPDD